MWQALGLIAVLVLFFVSPLLAIGFAVLLILAVVLEWSRQQS